MEQLSERDTLVRRVQIVPIEVIVRNIAAGSLSKRIGYPEGTKLKSTVLDRKSTRLNSSHLKLSRMPSPA